MRSNCLSRRLSTMYIKKQRKDVKTCLSFQRHNSKLLKNSLRRIRVGKHIHALSQLLSRLLRISYRMSTIQKHILQAILATPPQIPISFDHSDFRIDPFPNHIFPQLRSLKRSIQKAKRAKRMEPIHWQSGIRPNRPFEPISQHIQNNFFNTPPRAEPPLRPTPRSRPNPTQYYLEQAAFYVENFGPDPFATDREVIKPGPLKVLVCSVINFLAKVFLPTLKAGASTVSGFVAFSNLVFQGLWTLLKVGCSLVCSIEWEALVAMAVASQLVKFLPGMGGALADGGEGEGPVYTMFVQGGRAIGSGPVIRESY